MGGKSSKLSKSEVSLVDQKKYIREPVVQYDERYGQKVRVYREMVSASRVAIISKQFEDEIKFNASVEIQRALGKLRHPGMIQLMNLSTKIKSKFCNQFYKMECLYDYVSDDLSCELERRIASAAELQNIPKPQLITYDLSEFMFQFETGEQLTTPATSSSYSVRVHYDESELWYIAVTVLAVLAYLEQRKLVHGDIRPKNICLTLDHQVKVMAVNSEINTNWSSYMDKLEDIPTKSTYISPIQLGALQHRVQRPVQNIPKSDVFCLGVILLECCLLESAQDIYDFVSYSINLTNRINRIRMMKKYSDSFISTLISMLTLDETKRPTPEQLFDFIASYSAECKNLFLLLVSKHVLDGLHQVYYIE